MAKQAYERSAPGESWNALPKKTRDLLTDIALKMIEAEVVVRKKVRRGERRR